MRCRDKALDWVKWVAAGGALGTGLTWMPGSSAALLVGIESYMVHHIGRIYGETLSPAEVAQVVKDLDLQKLIYRAAFLEGVNLIPVLGGVLKIASGIGIVNEIGKAIVDDYFEPRYPDREYRAG